MMKPVLALIATTLLSGCISIGAKPPKTLLTLTSAEAVAPATTRVAGPGQTVTILMPSAPAAIANNRVPVYDGAASLAYVKDALWNDSPPHMFQRLLSETVAARTGRVVLDLRQYTIDPGTRLNGTLQRFGIDPAGMQAVVTFDGVLATGKGAVETRRFEARVPVTTIEARPAGAALNQAANQVAAEVSSWIGDR